MKRFIILFAFLSLFLFGCGNNSYEVHNDSENTYPEIEDGTDEIYIVNMSTKTYHLPECTYAKNMKEENREESSNLSALNKKGYKPCSRCIKNNES